MNVRADQGESAGRMTYRTRPGFYIGRPNERRADRAEAMLAVSTMGLDDATLDLLYALAHLMHFCRRAGIDWDAAVEQAAGYAVSDLEDGPPVKRDTDRFPVRVEA